MLDFTFQTHLTAFVIVVYHVSVRNLNSETLTTFTSCVSRNTECSLHICSSMTIEVSIYENKHYLHLSVESC